MLTRKRAGPLLLSLALALSLLAYQRYQTAIVYTQWLAAIESRPVKASSNSTLGFGTVVVVSKAGSERRHALVQAANVTEVELTVPAQPQWSEGDVKLFVNGQENVQRGSMLAWLGHRNALRW